MEHTQSFSVQDILLLNPSGLYDILIFDPKIAKFNVKEVKFSLQDESGNVLKLIDNLDYTVYNGSILNQGKTKSNSNIFPTQDIPFSYVKLHVIYIVIHNIDLELKNMISDKKFIIFWTESNVHPPLNPDDSHTPISLPWNTGTQPENEDNTELRIIDNMLGVNRVNYFMDDDYTNENGQLFAYNTHNQYLVFKVNHLDESFNYKPNGLTNFDYYSYGKLLYLLIYRNKNIHTNSEMYAPVMSETCKIPFNKIVKLEQVDSTYRYEIVASLGFGGIDGITNIKLLCDNTKFNVEKMIFSSIKNKKINNQWVHYESVNEIEYKIKPFGYEANGLDNYLVIITMCSLRCDIRIEISLEHELDTKNLGEFSIVFDRMVFDTMLRRNLANKMDLIDEYYITDIADYYK